MPELPTSGSGSPGPEASPGSPPSRGLEIATGVLALAFSGTFIALSRMIHVNRESGGIDPRWWPTALGIAAAVLAAAFIVVATRATLSREDIEPSTRSGQIGAVATVVAAVIYIFVWPLIGFLAATFILLASLTAVYGARDWRVLLIFPAALAVFLYVLFATLLRVPL